MPYSSGPRYTPGYTTPFTAVFEAVGPHGGKTGVFRYCKAGDTLPPTPLPRQKWVAVRS